MKRPPPAGPACGLRPSNAPVNDLRPARIRLAIMTVIFASICVLLGFLAAGGESAALPRTNASAQLAPLSFNSSGFFQISVFEDLHYGENEDSQWAPDADRHTDVVIQSILGYEHQSFVVINGDLITGENTFPANSSHYVDRIVDPLVARDIPWGSTYGNHDSDLNCSRHHILAREKLRGPSLAYTRSDVAGKPAGVSNYYLPIYSSSDPSGLSAPAAIIWFFDSRGGNYFQEHDANGSRVPQPNWVDQSVVDWFRSTNSKLNQTYGGAAAQQIPSIAFVHIPTKASESLQVTGQNNFTEPGINDDYLLAMQSLGWTPDGQTGTPAADNAYGGQDKPFMQALVDTPGLMAVFSGHDHGNDWCWKWQGDVPDTGVTGDGIVLCFGRHTGYGGYGNWERGSRQILLSEELLKENVVETWVRLEHGSVYGDVVLNSTYGQDEYPATPDTYTYCDTCIYPQ